MIRQLCIGAQRPLNTMLEEMPPELSLKRNEGWVEAGRFLDKQRVVLAIHSEVHQKAEGESPGYKVRGKFGGIDWSWKVPVLP